MLAGINAVQHVLGEPPRRFGRDEAYLGVLVDDLTTRGVLEPYRMFTSRAEYRLHLREDNADARLTPTARELGLVGDSCWRAFEQRQGRINRESERLHQTGVKPTEEINAWLDSLGSACISDAATLASLLKRPELRYCDVVSEFPCCGDLSEQEQRRVETEIKFAGYLERQQRDIKRLQRMEAARIPKDFDYEDVSGLRAEIRQRLSELRPETLGQASRVFGVTPAAVSLLSVYLKRHCRHIS